MGGIVALFAILAIGLSVAGFLMRMRNGGGGGWYAPRRYGYRPWGPQIGMGGPMQPGMPWDPMQANPAQADPFAGGQPSAPSFDPGAMSGGFAAPDPGGMAPPAGDGGGGTMGSIPS